MSPNARTKLARTFALTFGMTLAVALATPATGHAQVCTSNSDCGKGTTCQVSGVPPKAPSECVKTGTCDPDVPTGDAVATVQPVSSCQAAPCQADSDCATDMVCHTQKFSVCSGGTSVRCAPNTTCDAGAAAPIVTCTESTTSTCAYRWQLPCSVDADCGESFTCMPLVTSTCSGAGPAPTPTPASAPSAEPDKGVVAAGGSGGSAGVTRPGTAVTCDIVKSFPGYCSAKATTCTADSDCPNAWTCAVVYAVTTTSDPAAPDGAGDIAPARPSVPSSPPTKLCQPPISLGVRGSDSVSVTDGTGSGVTPTGGPATGTPTGAPASGSASAPSVSGENGALAPHGNSGCSVGGSSPAAATLLGAAALALLTLLLTVRRQKSATASRR